MWVSIIDTVLTFFAHVMSGTHLAPMRFSKKKTYAIWFIWAAFYIFSSPFIKIPQKFTTSFGVFAFIITWVLQLTLFFFTTKGRFGERTFLIMSYATFFTTCCALTQWITEFFLPRNEWDFLIVYGILLGLMLWIFIGKLLPVFLASSPYIHKAWTILCALMALFMGTLMTWFVYPSRIGDFKLSQTWGLPLLSVVLFVTYAVIFVCIRNIASAEKAKQMQLQVELLTTQVNAWAKTEEENRMARHDLRHHNLALLSLAKQGKSQEIASYLQDLIGRETPPAQTIWCEHATINSILSVYAAKAMQQHVDVDIKAQVEKDLPLSSSDVVTVVANLFENAIQAAVDSGIQNPYVSIHLYRKEDKFVVCVVNDCKMGLPRTVTQGEYGLGLSSVQQVVNAHDGELSLTVEGTKFHAFALLNVGG